MKLIRLAAVAACLSVLPLTFANAQDKMTPEQCTASFTKMDVNGDGSLGGKEAEKFVEKMTTVNRTPKVADIISKEEYVAECEMGTFAGMAG